MMYVLDGMIRKGEEEEEGGGVGSSLARSLELTFQWECIL